MPSTSQLPEKQRDDMIQRLKRIEGQAKGIQKMIDDGRECADVINQIAAMKAAITAASGEMLECFALHCLRHPEQFASQQEAVEEAVKALVRSGR